MLLSSTQIFVFGGFMLRANSIGHLEQIDRYGSGHQINFRKLNYVVGIQGYLIFEGFAAPIVALALNPEQTVRSKDGSLDPAGLCTIMELATGDPEEMASLANPKMNRTLLTTEALDTPLD